MTIGLANTIRHAPDIGGGGLVINEIDLFLIGEFDQIELYGTPSTNFTFWLSDGNAAPEQSNATTDENGFMVVTEGTDFTFDVSSYDVVYLWNDTTGLGSRIDKMGLNGEYWDGSAQRYPDSAGPNDGYNFATSGIFDADRTLGTVNINTLPEFDGLIPLFGMFIGIPVIIFSKRKK